MKKAKEASDLIKKKFNKKIDYALIAGSGIKLFDDIASIFEIKYEDIPHFPKPTVEGHKGILKIFSINNKNIAVFFGRVHFYEGYSPWEITFPIRLIYYLGIKKIIITNAAGSLKEHIKPGSIVLLNDYINFAQKNPLIGKHIPINEDFISMEEPFDIKMMNKAEAILKEKHFMYNKGTYIFLTGPAYETKAEVKMLSMFGDVVGMSTVPEVIMAKKLGLKILGLTICTNYSTGLSKTPLHHEEVVEMGKRVERELDIFIKQCIENEI